MINSDDNGGDTTVTTKNTMVDADSINNNETKTDDKKENTTMDDSSHESKENMKKDDKIFYDRLVNIANQELVRQTNKLQDDIGNVSFLEHNGWNNMINFSPLLETSKDLNNGMSLRQDNEMWLTFPNKLSFDQNTLEKLSLTNFYDSKVYLSNLIIVGNILNPHFQKMMSQDILKNDKKVLYKAGPLKKVERCIAKAENGMCLYMCVSLYCVCAMIYSMIGWLVDQMCEQIDYATKPYPNRLVMIVDAAAIALLFFVMFWGIFTCLCVCMFCMFE